MIRVTARVPERFRSHLGTWASGPSDRYDMIRVVETFDTSSHEAAKLGMCRLLIPLGVTIADMSGILLPDEEKYRG